MNTYNNWKVITETDFVTLFIKTWFAYIGTLREMFPDDYNRQGDKKYLKSYKEYFNAEGYKKLIIDDVLFREIEMIYEEGRKIILQKYPEYYFEDFYRMNTNLKYLYKDISPDRKNGLVISIKHKEKGIYSYYIIFWGEIRKQKYKDKIKGKVNLQAILDSQKNDLNETTTEFEYMIKIFNELKNKLIMDIENKFAKKISKDFMKSIENKYLDLKERIKTNFISLMNLNTKLLNEKTFEEILYTKNEYCFLEQNPINYFLYYRDASMYPNRKMESVEEQAFNNIVSQMRKDSMNWFLDFVYRLRNALFHEIIDPFDKEWQIIFKNSYLLLKELVDMNIVYLEKEKNDEAGKMK